MSFGKDNDSPSGYTQATQTSEPWRQQQPYLKDVWRSAQQLGRTPMQYFPDKGYVDLSPQTSQGLQSIMSRAQAGSPVRQGAQDTMAKTVSGEFLNANPYLDRMYDAAAQGVTRNFRDAISPGIDLDMIRAEADTSPSHYSAKGAAMDSLGRTLGNLSAQIYGGNYATERGLQQQASMAAPAFAASDYADAERMLGVGGVYEGQSEAELADRMARWNFEQQEPWERLQRYSSQVQGGDWGGTTTTSEPYYRNRTAGLLGGAASGAGIAQMLGASNPWSWGLAGAGAALGYA